VLTLVFDAKLLILKCAERMWRYCGVYTLRSYPIDTQLSLCTDPISLDKVPDDIFQFTFFVVFMLLTEKI